MPDIMVTGGRIPADIQYFLDGSAECYDIPPDVYFWARTFEPDITGIIDSFDADPQLNAIRDHSARLSRYGEQLEKLYLHWQTTASFEEVALCLGYGMHWSPAIDKFIGDIITLVDSRQGVMARVYAEYAEHQTDLLVFYNGQKMFERKLGFMQSLYRIQQQWDALNEHPNFDDYKIIYPKSLTNVSRTDETDWDDDHVVGRKKKITSKVLPKETKKALKRSAELLNGITGSKTTQLFLSGKAVVVTGQKYKFTLVKQQYGNISTNHGSAQTEVHDLETGEFVCGLCVYTPNVTVFDHLASIVLHCKSGLEEQIIMEANITKRGNLELLPDSKKQATHVTEQNQIILDGLNPFNPRMENLLEHMNGPNWIEIQRQQKLIDDLNNKLKAKTIKRIIRKHASILPKRVVRFDNVRTLFYGPEIY
jgi:hypothetical protein